MNNKLKDFFKRKSQAALFVKNAIKDKQLVAKTWKGKVPGSFGNGASWARKGSQLDDIFNIKFVKYKNKITHIQFDGLKTGNKSIISNYISPQIRQEIYNNNSVCVMCGETDELEIDHIIGAKKFQINTDPILSEVDGYQLTCKRCNSYKRQKCKECQSAKIRPISPPSYSIAFTAGGSNLMVKDGMKFNSNEHNPCNGCYWSDRKKFIQEYELIPNKRSLLKIVEC